MSRFLRRLIPIAFAPLLMASALSPDDTSEPNPAIWLLSDEDTRIYMIGTNHILPTGYDWRSNELNAIIAGADELVLETADDEEFAENIALFQERVQLDAPIPLAERVSARHRSRLLSFVKRYGIPVDHLDGVETWAAAIGLSMLPMFLENQEGNGPAKPFSGAEEELMAIFDEAGKPTSGLETSDEQLGFLSSISDAGQVEMLEIAIDDLVAVDTGLTEDEMLSSWRNGDIATLDRECDSEENFTAEVRERLLESRNARWRGWVMRRLESPGNILLAVGACHLAGSVSLQTMLRDEGFTVTRVH